MFYHSIDKVFSAKYFVHTAAKIVLYFWLPFTGIHSHQIRKQISSIFSSAFPHLIRFIFRPTRCLSHFFTFRDRVSEGLRSRVAYSFKCQCCSALFVGQTTYCLSPKLTQRNMVAGQLVIGNLDMIHPSIA